MRAKPSPSASRAPSLNQAPTSNTPTRSALKGGRKKAGLESVAYSVSIDDRKKVTQLPSNQAEIAARKSTPLTSEKQARNILKGRQDPVEVDAHTQANSTSIAASLEFEKALNASASPNHPDHDTVRWWKGSPSSTPTAAQTKAPSPTAMAIAAAMSKSISDASPANITEPAATPPITPNRSPLARSSSRNGLGR